MTLQKDPNLTRRNRLSGFDYANPGYYFLTACTLNREHAFGKVEAGKVVLSEIGVLVLETLHLTESALPNVEVDCAAILPNHVHILLYLGLVNTAATVSTFMKQFKGAIAARVRRAHLMTREGALCQKGFNDVIVRDDLHLDQIRAYIVDNPRKWAEDEYA